MPTRTFRGGVGGTPTSWDVAGNWEEGAVPGDGDDLRFPATAVASALVGLPSGDINFASWTIDFGFAHSIGASGTPVKCACDQLIRRGGVDVYLEVNHPTGPEHLDEVINVGGSGELVISNLSTEIAQRIMVRRGRVRLSGYASQDLPFLQVGSDAGQSDAELVIEAPGAGGDLDIDYLEAVAGLVTVNTGDSTNGYDITMLDNSGAQIVINGTRAITDLLQGGGRTIHDGTGTITNARLKRGILDHNQRQVARTVTNRWLYPTAKHLRDPNLVTIGTDHYMGATEDLGL